MRNPAPPFKPRSKYPSTLSAKYESGGHGDPGAISATPNDPGGASYGSVQLSSGTKTVDAFIASPESSRWREDFRGLRPGTPEFDMKWKQIAKREPGEFGGAQESFVGRTHYDEAVRSVLHRTGINLDGASEAVRQATFSTGVQHRKSADVLTEAIRQADRLSKRSDREYQRNLLNAIYDQRTAYVAAQRDRARRAGNQGQVQVFGNVLRRYPRERVDALLLLE
jgi:hypothetical protein